MKKDLLDFGFWIAVFKALVWCFSQWRSTMAKLSEWDLLAALLLFTYAHPVHTLVRAIARVYILSRSPLAFLPDLYLKLNEYSTLTWTCTYKYIYGLCMLYVWNHFTFTKESQALRTDIWWDLSHSSANWSNFPSRCRLYYTRETRCLLEWLKNKSYIL